MALSRKCSNIYCSRGNMFINAPPPEKNRGGFQASYDNGQLIMSSAYKVHERVNQGSTQSLLIGNMPPIAHSCASKNIEIIHDSLFYFVTSPPKNV